MSRRVFDRAAPAGRAAERRDGLATPCALVRALGAPLRDTASGRREVDAAVVLGSPVSRSGGLTSVLEERVAAGVGLWARGEVPLLCMTGGGPPGRVEADAMAARARALGVPSEAIWLERRARNTEENARHTAAMLLPAGRRRVWVITQPFHSRRARRLFELAGFDALVWHIEDSVEFRHPAAVRWIAREYAAWARRLIPRGSARRG